MIRGGRVIRGERLAAELVVALYDTKRGDDLADVAERIAFSVEAGLLSKEDRDFLAEHYRIVRQRLMERRKGR